MNKVLTIITVNFNNIAGLEKTVDSVLPQLSDCVDYVIIDGGSSDPSPTFIESVKKHLLYSCSESDGGIYQGMNKGVRNADGRYLLFLNSGDTLCHGVIEKVLPLLEREAADIIYGNIRFCNPENGWKRIKEYPDKVTLNHLYESHLPHPGSFIRRQLLVDMPYNESLRINADWEFFVKAIMLNGCSTFHVPFTISNFYLGGLSDANRDEHDREREEIKQRLFSPVIQDAARLSKIETLGCYTEIRELSETRKLHKRVRPLLRAVLAVDKIFHKKKK